VLTTVHRPETLVPGILMAPAGETENANCDGTKPVSAVTAAPSIVRWSVQQTDNGAALSAGAPLGAPQAPVSAMRGVNAPRASHVLGKTPQSRPPGHQMTPFEISSVPGSR